MGENKNGIHISSELQRGRETTVFWEVKNWNTTDYHDFELIKFHSSCIVDINPPGFGSSLGEVEGERYGANLRFFFENSSSSSRSGTYWLRLSVEQLFNREDRIIQYEFKVEQVDDKLAVISGAKFVNTRGVFRIYSGNLLPIKLHEEFIELESKGPNDGPLVFPRPPILRIKISVTPIFISAHSDTKAEEEAKAEMNAGLSQALKDMFAAEDNYADLKLETKDNMTLSAHKFMLAARSPVLHNMIEKKVKEDNGFNGTIKLAGVKAKPMVVILHWIYTGELHASAGKCMEEVVDAAILLELTGLIKIMDNKLISICNAGNMFQLYQVAKKNGMGTASSNIGQFIKEHV